MAECKDGDLNSPLKLFHISLLFKFSTQSDCQGAVTASCSPNLLPSCQADAM